MIIECNKEGREAIEKLCDVALKAGGINNLQAVLEILQKAQIKEIDVPSAKKEKTK
jgi:hypothetical protein